MDKDQAKLAKEISDYMANWFGYEPGESDEFAEDLAVHLLALYGKKKNNGTNPDPQGHPDVRG